MKLDLNVESLLALARAGCRHFRDFAQLNAQVTFDRKKVLVIPLGPEKRYIGHCTNNTNTKPGERIDLGSANIRGSSFCRARALVWTDCRLYGFIRGIESDAMWEVVGFDIA